VIPLKYQFAYPLRVSAFWKVVKDAIFLNILRCIHTAILTMTSVKSNINYANFYYIAVHLYNKTTTRLVNTSISKTIANHRKEIF